MGALKVCGDWGGLVYSREPHSSSRAQEDIGLLDKEALYPFGGLHEATSFCFPRHSLELLFEADLHSTSNVWTQLATEYLGFSAHASISL